MGGEKEARLMAQTIVQAQSGERGWKPLLYAGLVGLGAGISYWLIGLVMNRYIVEPMACRDITEGAQCLNAPFLSGDIAGVIVAVFALMVLVVLRQTRPIVIVASVMALLWGVKALFDGLPWWGEMLALVGVYGLAYVTFAWVNRAANLWVAIGLALAIVLLGRILLVS